jgi:hypothetical protein
MFIYEGQEYPDLSRPSINLDKCILFDGRNLIVCYQSSAKNEEYIVAKLCLQPGMEGGDAGFLEDCSDCSVGAEVADLKCTECGSGKTPAQISIGMSQ